MSKKQTINFDYNTEQKPIQLREFGRNMQNLIQYGCKIKDKNERNQVANQIVDLMVHFNPEFTNKEDHLHKIWDYLHIMSEFKLDVDSPFPKPNRSLVNLKPEKVDYINHKITFKHYGHAIELMIEKAIAMENNSPQKETLVHYIACLMKMYYKLWNKENIQDSVIIEHLRYLSDNQLDINNEKFNLDILLENIGRNEKSEERRNLTYPKTRKNNNYQQNSSYQNRNNQNSGNDNYSNKNNNTYRNNNYQQNRYSKNNQGGSDSKPGFKRHTNRQGPSTSFSHKTRRPDTDSRPNVDKPQP